MFVKTGRAEEQNMYSARRVLSHKINGDFIRAFLVFLQVWGRENSKKVLGQFFAVGFIFFTLFL